MRLMALLLGLLAGPAAAQTASPLPTQGQGVRTMALSQDGFTLASMDRTAIHLWDILAAREKATLRAADGPVTFMAFSPDGTALVSVSSGVVHYWDVATGREAFPFGRGRRGDSVAFSPDGRLLAIARRRAVVVWDLQAAREAGVFSESSAEVTATVFSFDGKLLVVGGSDRVVRLWDVAERRIKAVLTPRIARGY